MKQNDIKSIIIDLMHTNTKIRKHSKTKELYHEVFNTTHFLPNQAKIKERIYTILNDITSIPTCACGELLKFLGPATGYRQYCSSACAAQSQTVQNKKQSTCLANHGVRVPAQSHQIQTKMQQTTNERYGVLHSQQSPDIRSKTKNTNKHKYGHECFTKSDTFKQSSSETYNKRYNSRVPSQSHITPRSWTTINNKRALSQLNETMSLVEIADFTGVSVSLISHYFQKHDLHPKIHHNKSKPEQQIKQFIMTLTDDCIFNDRQIIKPKELDVVLPTYKLAIEFCGLYWHSDVHDRIDRFYHSNKTEECRQKGIQLITIFEDEWYDKQHIIENILKHKMHKSHGVYARRCTIVDVSPKVKKQFLNHYHIQGNGRGSITYGLQCDNDLVACMTFINYGNGIYELNRFATHNSIVGGFSKLLNHFKNMHRDWVTIISYADKRFSVGDVYKKNKFILTSDSLPAYSYISQKKRYHRKRFMKHLLPKMLTSFNPNLTERENVANHNIHRIWDCGQLRYELTNTT